MTRQEDGEERNVRRPLEAHRDRAERLLNRVRIGVLLLLAAAAMAYAPSLPASLDLANWAVLTPVLAWALVQLAVLDRRPVLPGWLSIVNPVVDITAVTAIIGGYALAQSPALAFETPIFLAYFIILAARPIATSARRSAAIAVLAVVEYGGLLLAFVASGALPVVADPVAASAGPGVSPLDEGAKLLFLAVAGAVATYATWWHERLALDSARAAGEREQLEARLAEARLEGLRMQLQPHFLFNALNTIAALVATDARAAERMVGGLSELLRLSLRGSAAQEVSLAREMEVLEHYLAIQRVRFHDRLTVRMDVAPDVLDALVPTLILQPLVENAIRHGIAPRAAPGTIELRAAHDHGVLRVTVRDDGVGERPGAPRLEGVGLGNARARLRSLYGDAGCLRASGEPSGGFVVELELPLRRTREGAGVAA